MDIEKLVKSPEVTATAAVGSIASLGTDDLLVHLGQLSLMNREPGASLSNVTVMDEASRVSFRDFGNKVFKAWERALHDLVCGGGEEAKTLRGKLIQAISKGKDAVSTAITVALTTYLGVNVALAAVIGLLVYEVVIKPFGVEFCNFWKLD